MSDSIVAPAESDADVKVNMTQDATEEYQLGAFAAESAGEGLLSAEVAYAEKEQELVGHEMFGSSVSSQRSYSEIFKSFALLGWIGFGGPAAHIALFEKEFVEKKKWMTQSVFLELLALGQCIPGPTSTQMSFAIGVIQKGIPGGLLSGILFQYPGFFIMSTVGLGSAHFLLNPSDLLRAFVGGLSAAGVALVVDAAWGLGNKICTSKETKFIAIVSAATTYYASATLVQLKAVILPLLIAWGGGFTLLRSRDSATASRATESSEAHMLQRMGLSLKAGTLLMSIWLLVLLLVISLRQIFTYSDAPGLYWFESFYRTGSLIFGGGQVVLPLLLGEVDTWMTEEQFYAGLGVVQALPGPLFNLSAYLGAIIGGVPGIAACWFGLFGPGVILIYGVLPFWAKFRDYQIYKNMLPGMNAAAVGLIVAACISMSFKVHHISPFPAYTVCLGLFSFSAVHFFNIQAPVAVVCSGVMGAIGGLM